MTTLMLNPETKQLIKANYDFIKQTDNKRVLATLEAIEKLPTVERNIMIAFLFGCDCKPSILGKLLQTSTQCASKIIRGIKSKLQKDPTLAESNFETDEPYTMC